MYSTELSSSSFFNTNVSFEGDDLHKPFCIGKKYFIIDTCDPMNYDISSFVSSRFSQDELRLIAAKRSMPDNVEKVSLKGGNISCCDVKHSANELQFYFPIVQSQVQNNQLVDEWLDRMFGCYAEFIRMWMAIYAFANHQILPMLILKGPRETGKTTFGEIVGSLYPKMWQGWDGVTSQFNEHVTKFLILIDDHAQRGRELYDYLKRLTGCRDQFTVNLKYGNKFTVRPNINVILTSNQALPLFIPPEEAMLEERSCGYFVFEPPKMKEARSSFKDEIVSAMGHYARTVLEPLYREWLAKETHPRYGIPCPVTDAYQDMVSQRGHAVVTDDDVRNLFNEICNRQLIINYDGMDVISDQVISSIAIEIGLPNAQYRSKMSKLGLLSSESIRKSGNNRFYEVCN